MPGTDVVSELERLARMRGETVKTLAPAALQEYVAGLVAAGRNSPGNFAALAKYAKRAGNTTLFLYLDGLAAGREVLPSIAARLEQVAGTAAREQVFAGFRLPPLGSPRQALIDLTQEVLRRLGSAVGPETARQVLAGNHHGISGASFAPLRLAYLEGGIDAALALRHRLLVQTLERHLANGEPWFEQVVTQAFVDHARANPEVAAGVREGDRIYFCKVPYSPQEYFDAQDPVQKRYFMCHCPLARESILDPAGTVDPALCHCSAGYTKVAFEIIFGSPVEVEVLESALAGDLRCRFAVRIPPRA